MRKGADLALGSSGKVKWFNDSKGFGFIERREGEMIFVHYSAIAGEGHKTLQPGEEVEFDLYDGRKGLEARIVSPRKAG
jgi:CspA family cold shock protein